MIIINSILPVQNLTIFVGVTLIHLTLKERFKFLLQKILGIERYLFVFALFIISTLKFNKRERDFLYFISLLKDGGIILDVGANIGVMSYYLSKRMPQSEIFAFEPIPENLKTLHKIKKFFKLNNVSIIDKALGEKRGRMEMIMPVVNSVKMQGLSHIVHDSLTDFNEGEKYEVEIDTLDNFMKQLDTGKEVAGLKLDVENFEYFVLKGGEALISRNRPIIYTELWENENRNKCFELVNGLNFRIKVLFNGELVDFEPGKHKTQNFFFVPD